MSRETGGHFETIESAHEFVSLLSETLTEVKKEIDADIEKASESQAPRRVQALQTVSYNLEKLAVRMKESRRILNDLRTLRRLLSGGTEWLAQRSFPKPQQSPVDYSRTLLADEHADNCW